MVATNNLTSYREKKNMLDNTFDSVHAIWTRA